MVLYDFNVIFLSFSWPGLEAWPMIVLCFAFFKGMEWGGNLLFLTVINHHNYLIAEFENTTVGLQQVHNLT